MSIAGVTPTNTEAAAKKSQNTFSAALGKDDFIKLLLTQLKYQDATDPLDDREMVAQMAQFSSLEQMENMNRSLETLAADMQQNSFLSSLMLIGRQIGYTLEGEKYAGTVGGLLKEDGQYVAVVGEHDVPISDINLVV